MEGERLPTDIRSEHVDAGPEMVLLRLFGDGVMPGTALLRVSAADGLLLLDPLPDPSPHADGGWRLAFSVPRELLDGAEIELHAENWERPVPLEADRVALERRITELEAEVEHRGERQRAAEARAAAATEALHAAREREARALRGRTPTPTEAEVEHLRAALAEAREASQDAERRVAETAATLRDEVAAHQAQRRRAEEAARHQEELAAQVDAALRARADVERELKALRARMDSSVGPPGGGGAERDLARALADAQQELREEAAARQAAERRAAQVVAEREQLLTQLDDLTAGLRSAWRGPDAQRHEDVG